MVLTKLWESSPGKSYLFLRNFGQRFPGKLYLLLWYFFLLVSPVCSDKFLTKNSLRKKLSWKIWMCSTMFFLLLLENWMCWGGQRSRLVLLRDFFGWHFWILAIILWLVKPPVSVTWSLNKRVQIFLLYNHLYYEIASLYCTQNIQPRDLRMVCDGEWEWKFSCTVSLIDNCLFALLLV